MLGVQGFVPLGTSHGPWANDLSGLRWEARWEALDRLASGRLLELRDADLRGTTLQDHLGEPDAHERPTPQPKLRTIDFCGSKPNFGPLPPSQRSGFDSLCTTMYVD